MELGWRFGIAVEVPSHLFRLDLASYLGFGIEYVCVYREVTRRDCISLHIQMLC